MIEAIPCEIGIEDQKVIIELYRDRFSLESIVKMMPKYNKYNIYKLLSANHLMRNDRDKSLKYYCNEHYFEKIDTEEKAYWLGFMYADGYIATTKNGSDNFGITLQESDKEHLEKFKKALCSNHPINIYKSAYGTYGVRLLICNQKMVNDLIPKGVYRRKSLILKFPNSNIIPNDLVYDFIRGYFDGDGSLKKSGINKRNCYRLYDFNLLGTYEFLEKVREVLDINYEIKKCNKNNDSNNYYLDFAKKSEVKRVTYLLYGNATIYLDRKYQRYKEI